MGNSMLGQTKYSENLVRNPEWKGPVRARWQDVLEKQCGRAMSGLNRQRRGTSGGFLWAH